MTAHRLLPSAPAAERGLLAAFLHDSRRVGALCAELRLTDAIFHHPTCALLFGMLQKLWTDGIEADFVSLTEGLRAAGKLEEVNGANFITSLAIEPALSSQAREYVRMIREAHALRGLIAASETAKERAYDPSENAAEVIAWAQAAIGALTIEQHAARQTFRQVMSDAVTNIENGRVSGADMTSGIATLDALVRMQRGNFIVIAGEAKSGKTALAVNILCHAAIREEKRCVIFSLEMSATEIAERMIAAEGRVNLAMVGREITEDQFARINRATNRIAIAADRIEAITDCFDLATITATVRQLHAKAPLDLIVLDYLQLIDGGSGKKGETRQEAVAQVSRTAKRLAGELGCVVIGLSQLNDDGKLRESRAIGQDANAVLAVERDESGGRKITIAAQRNGQSGVSAAVQWLPQFTLFTDEN